MFYVYLVIMICFVGIGTPKNYSSALHYYSLGAKKFGHFECIHQMGLMHYEGKGVKRSAKEAIVIF